MTFCPPKYNKPVTLRMYRDTGFFCVTAEVGDDIIEEHQYKLEKQARERINIWAVKYKSKKKNPNQIIRIDSTRTHKPKYTVKETFNTYAWISGLR